MVKKNRMLFINKQLAIPFRVGIEECLCGSIHQQGVEHENRQSCRTLVKFKIPTP